MNEAVKLDKGTVGYKRHKLSMTKGMEVMLNTELLVEYLNEHEHKNYRLKSLLNLIDEIINDF